MSNSSEHQNNSATYLEVCYDQRYQRP